MAQGKPVRDSVRAIGVTEDKYRDELLKGEIFYILKEAKAVIEAWRRHYSAVRLHSLLGYRPPAPQTTVWPPDQQFTNQVARMRSLN